MSWLLMGGANFLRQKPHCRPSGSSRYITDCEHVPQSNQVSERKQWRQLTVKPLHTRYNICEYLSQASNKTHEMPFASLQAKNVRMDRC